MILFSLNSFVPEAPFLYPLNYQKTLRLSDVLRGYRKGAMGANRLMLESVYRDAFRILSKHL